MAVRRIRPPFLHKDAPWPLPDVIKLTPSTRREGPNDNYIPQDAWILPISGNLDTPQSFNPINDVTKLRLRRVSELGPDVKSMPMGNWVLGNKYYDIPEWLIPVKGTVPEEDRHPHLLYKIELLGRQDILFRADSRHPSGYYIDWRHLQGWRLRREDNLTRHTAVEEHLSFDEAIMRSELHQAAGVGKIVGCLQVVASSLKAMSDQFELKSGAKKADLEAARKVLDKVSSTLSDIDVSNINPEMERLLFIYSLIYTFAEFGDAYKPHHDRDTKDDLLREAFRVVKHYWTVEMGSILDSHGSMDVDAVFLDIGNEVSAIAKKKKVPKKEARMEIMNRALDAIRTTHVYRDHLEALKVWDPKRFKDVTVLGEPAEPASA